MSRSIHLVTVLAALGSAIVGGVMYAFSSFVMSGLDRAPPRQAVGQGRIDVPLDGRDHVEQMMRDARALVDPNSAEAAARWATYHREWTRANHVRTLTSLISAGLFVAALVRA